MYWRYFKYIVEHKYNVMKVCFKHKKYLMGLLHDWDKFLPDEFIPYARYFYGGEKTDASRKAFNKAWEKHYNRNTHHWDAYVISFAEYAHRNEEFKHIKCEISGTDVLAEMPLNAVLEMIYDWTAMGIKFGDTAQEYYLKNYHKIKLNRDTRFLLEANLRFCDLYELGPICECNAEYWMTLEELAIKYGEVEFRKDMAKIEKTYNISNIYDAVTTRKG